MTLAIFLQATLRWIAQACAGQARQQGDGLDLHEAADPARARPSSRIRVWDLDCHIH
jgi:hypothetical protein